MRRMSSALRTLHLLTAAALIACGSGVPAAAPAPAPATPQVEPQPSAAATPEPQPSAAATPTPAPEAAAKDTPPAQQPHAAEQPAQPRAPKLSSKPAAETAAPPKPAEPAAPAVAPAPAAPTAPTAATPCGEKNQPRCPLQGWMENHLQSAVDESDLASVEKGLTQLARLAPDHSWDTGNTGWSTLAKTGAAAAANGDMNAVKQTCKTCHKTWRSKYKQSAFRSRPIP